MRLLIFFVESVDCPMALKKCDWVNIQKISLILASELGLQQGLEQGRQK
ncbi:MAG: hypothetical protein KAU26_11390 [Methylococcales bacterium]|nr:hypothetical protein [Methylococcales bacterium]